MFIGIFRILIENVWAIIYTTHWEDEYIVTVNMKIDISSFILEVFHFDIFILTRFMTHNE